MMTIRWGWDPIVTSGTRSMRPRGMGSASRAIVAAVDIANITIPIDIDNLAYLAKAFDSFWVCCSNCDHCSGMGSRHALWSASPTHKAQGRRRHSGCSLAQMSKHVELTVVIARQRDWCPDLTTWPDPWPKIFSGLQIQMLNARSRPPHSSEVGMWRGR